MKKWFLFLICLMALKAHSQSTTLVISQIYGAGGNTGAPLNADYVELHNISTVAQNLAGLSIQYASATNTNWTGVAALPSLSIPPGGYFLIQMSSTGTNGSPLPTVDHQAAPTIAMSATSGKVALVNGTTPLTGCPTTSVIDLIGYGTANCSETSPAGILSVTDANFRNNNGCTDTNNNQSDFTIAAPAPRNAASPVFICGGPPPPPALTAGTVNDFGNITVATVSPSQSFALSGSNLTGAPGNININAPSADFQVSSDNTNWSAGATISYTSATLSSTPVYVRFTPQSPGPKSGNIQITGGGVATAVTVAVRGNGIAPSTPVLTATGTLNFGTVCINTVAGPQNFTISGSDLTSQPVVITPVSGYQFATASGGPYSNSLNITQPGGTFSQVIYVQFNPLAVTNYDGIISINGGGIAAAISQSVSGQGVNTAATVTTEAASAITTSTATLSGTLPSTGCSNVTSYGFEYSTISGFVNGTVASSTNLSGSSFSAGIAGLSPATQYFYKAFADNAQGRVYGIERSFRTEAPPPPTMNATALSIFNTTCVHDTDGPNSFDLSGNNLLPGTIAVGPLEGYTFALSAAGPFADTLFISNTGSSISQTIFVLFSPLQEASYQGDIPVSGAGVSAFAVPVAGNGIDARPSVVTGDSSLISANIVEAAGSILDPGCSDVSSFGIEYSGINGFINGTGRRVSGIMQGTERFSSRLENLVQNTIYYYKAYAVNNGGITYGSQRFFITPAIPAGLIIYNVPIKRGGMLHYSLSGLKRGHYSTRIHNSLGQLVYQRDLIVQVDFIDETFYFPAHLPMGLYNLEVRNHEFKIQKSFLVN